ncbi:hypothetical protein M514_06065 [Trichuris suis]|uniref:Uncharacterized protein n=1 Tax=Trichuris suis TaxID=68888 RepID=A0A085NMK3_9BILA|nr:hypothetical protein M513_06065 [Trichuris suis]KFD70699.1 hypothetical protein M514_06065 [Trichuris suis]
MAVASGQSPSMLLDRFSNRHRPGMTGVGHVVVATVPPGALEDSYLLIMDGVPIVATNFWPHDAITRRVKAFLKVALSTSLLARGTGT